MSHSSGFAAGFPLFLFSAFYFLLCLGGGFEVALMWPFWFQHFSLQHFSFCQTVASGDLAGCLRGPWGKPQGGLRVALVYESNNREVEAWMCSEFRDDPFKSGGRLLRIFQGGLCALCGNCHR